ncbi:hypothetical protein GF360_03815 [candidate division WWE3 bacterium]|nr:hypothetical protein [candidate division WWE3 bacterium]
MSLTLSIIKEQNRLNILKVLEVYLENLNKLYSLEELEQRPIIFRNGESVLGFLTEAPAFIGKKEGSNFLIEGVKLGDKNLALVKIGYKQGTSPLESLEDLLSKEGLENSSFLSILHTGRIYETLEQQPPCLTDGGNIYMSVGAITKYFLQHEKGKQYVEDSKEKSPPNIINNYFSERLDTRKFDKLTSSEHTGLKHFTTFYHEEDGRIKVTFLQLSKERKARYFFSPDVVFCNSECLLRGIRYELYSTKTSKIRDRLLRTSVEL